MLAWAFAVQCKYNPFEVFTVVVLVYLRPFAVAMCCVTWAGYAIERLAGFLPALSLQLYLAPGMRWGWLLAGGGAAIYGISVVHLKRLRTADRSIPMTRTSVPLVLVPGLKGTALYKESTGDLATPQLSHAQFVPLVPRTHYVSIPQVLNLVAPSITMPIVWCTREGALILPENDDIDGDGRLVPASQTKGAQEWPEQASDGLVARGALHSLCLFGGVCWRVYESFLLWVRPYPGGDSDKEQGQEHNRQEARPFYVFPYDWRRDNLETTAKLEQYIARVSRRHNSKVQVVAHSMGGVLTLAALHRAPEHYHSVVFVGTPFGPGPGYVEDLHQGNSLGYNWRTFTVAAGLSFGSSWFSFPQTLSQELAWDCGIFVDTAASKDERRISEEHLYSEEELAVAATQAAGHLPEVVEGLTLPEVPSTWRRVKMNFFDAQQWKDLRFSLFSDKAVREEALQALADALPEDLEKLSADEVEELLLLHMQTAMRKGMRFRREFQYRSDVAYPPIAVVAGDGRPTKNYILLDGPKSVRGVDFEGGPKIPGDGRIPFKSAIPPKGIPHQLYRSDLRHTELLYDVQLFASILADFLEPEEETVSQ